MKKNLIVGLIFFVLSGITLAANWQETPGKYAIIKTSLGTIVCQLFPEKAPNTVENFVGLAEGTKEWIDPKTGQKVKKRFYDGLTFHRVIPNFMIQGGCPLGTGTGGPGYKFADEISDLKFDIPGRLAMANAGPNTNGSQFFITEVPTPWLNGHHTIFGQLVEGMEVLKQIARVERDNRDKPLKPVIIEKVIIKDVGGKKKIGGGGLMNKKVAFVVAPQNFRDEEYLEPKKILSDSGISVITASLKTGELSGMLGARINADILVEEIKPAEISALVLVGGSGADIYWSHQKVHELIKQVLSENKPVAAICIAPVTLARAGVLSGKNATCFSSVKEELIKAGAKFQTKSVVQDGLIITASGPAAAKEFGQTILKAINK